MPGMTIFAVPKAFEGSNAVIQRNAIISWTKLRPRPEIFLFGDEPGTAEIADELNVTHIPRVERNELGTPLLNCIFERAQEYASSNICCYVNADMILMQDFADAAEISARKFRDFVMVGQRWDVDIERPINFDGNWQEAVKQEVQARGKLHAVTGVDYLVFNRPFWNDMPAFAVGRAAWNNWLVYETLVKQRPVVDATQVVCAVHQNHDYHHVPGGDGRSWEGPEVRKNRALAGNECTDYGFISNANFVLTGEGTKAKHPLRKYPPSRAFIEFEQSRLYLEAEEMTKKGDARGALAKLDEANFFKKGNTQVLYARAVVMAELGMLDEALADAEKLCELTGNSAESTDLFNKLQKISSKAGGKTGAGSNIQNSAEASRGGGPKFSFVMIVLNGMPFIEYSLKSVYDFAHEIIIVEGAVKDCMFAANQDGSSRDGTVEFIKSFPDPGGKIRLVQGGWPEKCEMQNEALKYVSGDYVWLIDSDEVYKRQHLEKVRELVSSDPEITQVNFIPDNFWKGLDYTFVSPQFSQKPAHYRRVFKFRQGCRFVTHRPPTMVWPGEKVSTEQIKPVEAEVTRQMGIKLYHYSYVLDSQVRQKMELYRRYGWEKSWGVDFGYWYNNCFCKWTPENRRQVEQSYPLWSNDRNTRTCLFEDSHPEVMADFARKFVETGLGGKVMRYVAGAIAELKTQKAGPVYAIETGTIRSYEEKHESTLHISNALGERGKLVSVDLEEDSIRISRDICKNAENVEWVLSDSISYLKNYTGPKLDLAFLDSANDAELIFQEMALVCGHINPGGVLIVDDAGVLPDGSGIENQSGAKKGHMVWQFLVGIGIRPEVLETSTGHGTQIKLKMTAEVLERVRKGLNDIYNLDEAQAEDKSRSEADNLQQCTAGAAGGSAAQKKNDRLKKDSGEVNRILFVRTDMIGDNILGATMLRPLSESYPGASITVVCQEHIAELYENIPYVKRIITFDRKRAIKDQGYKSQILSQVQSEAADICINSVYSRELLTDEICIASGAGFKAAFDGDLCNIAPAVKNETSKHYNLIVKVDNNGEDRCELDKYRRMLEEMGIGQGPDEPMLYLTEEDELFAEDVFRQAGFDPEKTIAFFAGVDRPERIYRKYGPAVESFCRRHGFSVIALGGERDREINEENLKLYGVDSINLSGKTTLRQCGAIIKKCGLAFGAETGLAHIACAVRTKNVILLGGGHFGRFMPYSAYTTAVSVPLECYGCDWRCRYNNYYCIEWMRPEILAQALEEAYARPVGEKSRILLQSRKYHEWSEDRPEWVFNAALTDLNKAEVVNSDKETRCDELKGPKYLVSAIVSTYNSEKFIDGCLKDLVEQSLYSQGKMEIVVVNSASEQNEEAVIKRYMAQYDHIKYIPCEQRETIYAAWNRAICAAEGKYITNANADDRHHPQMLEKLAAVLERNPDKCGAYSNFYKTVVENSQWHNKGEGLRNDERPDFDRQKLLEGYYLGPQPMWRKSLHDEFGLFDESFKVAGDYEWGLRVSQKYDYIYVPELLGLYYYSPDSLERSAGTVDNETQVIQSLYRNAKGVIRRPFVNETPCISVVMRNYNKQKYIGEAIESIQNQTLKDWELVIVDDCSTDESVREVEKYLSDKRIKLVSMDINSGVSAAARKGISVAASPVVAMFDSDDFLRRDSLELLFAEHVLDPDAGLVYSQFAHCDENLIVKEVGWADKVPEGKNNLEADKVGAIRSYKKKFYNMTSGHDTTFASAEDKDMSYKMEEVSGLKFLNECLYYYRQLPDNTSIDQKKLVFGTLAHAKVKINAVVRRCNRIAEQTGENASQMIIDQLSKLYHNDKQVPQYLKIINIRRDYLEEHTEQAKQWKDLDDVQFVIKTAVEMPFKDFMKCVESCVKIKSETKVTVYLTAYNMEKYIRQSLESVLNQTYVALEIIVVDDGSTDGTAEVVKSFSDNRIRYIYQPHSCCAAARNRAVSEATGIYVLSVDADDFIDRDYVEKMMDFIQKCPEYDYYYPSGMALTDEAGRPTGAWDYNDFEDSSKLPGFLFANGFMPIPNSGSVVKKEIFERLGGYKEVENTEDFDFFTRNASQIRFKRVEGSSYYYYRRLARSNSSQFATRNEITAGAMENMLEQYRPEMLCPQIQAEQSENVKKQTLYKYAAAVFDNLARKFSDRHGEIFAEYANKYRETASRELTQKMENTADNKMSMSDLNESINRFNQGLGYLNNNDSEKALRVFETLSGDDEFNANLEFAKAVAFIGLGDRETGRVCLEKAIQIVPDHAQANRLLSKMSVKNTAKAV